MTRIGELGETISESQLKVHILNNLPIEYEGVIKQLEDKINELSIEDVKIKLSTKYQRIKKRVSGRRQNSRSNGHDDDNINEETALAAYTKTFKGRCRSCGKYGHKAADCQDDKEKKSNGETKADDDKKGPTTTKFQGRCKFCNIYGHKEADCRHKKRQQSNEKANTAVDKEEEEEEIGFCAIEKELEQVSIAEILNNEWAMTTKDENKHMAIADTGASCNMTPDDTYLYDCTEAPHDAVVKLGNKSILRIKKYGKKKCQVKNQNGEMTTVTINFAHVPGLWTTLISLTNAMEKGFALQGKEKTLILKKGKAEIIFDKQVKTPRGFLLATELTILLPTENLAMAALEPGKKVNIQEMHELLGHPHIQAVRATAKNMGIELTGKFQECEDCALAKARRLEIPKETMTKTEKPGEHLAIDISSIRNASYGNSKYWLLIVDYATRMKWSIFLKAKDELAEKMVTFLCELKKKHKCETKFI